jgi:hypothetical protein
VIWSIEMRLRNSAVIVLLMLAGCSSEKIWVNASKTETQFYADRAECQAMASGTSPSPAYTPPAPNSYGNQSVYGSFMQGYSNAQIRNAARARQQIFSDCMMGKGWRIVDKPK